MSEGNPGSLRRTLLRAALRRRILLGTILAATPLAAFAAGGAGVGTPAGTEAGWTEFQDDKAGISVDYPTSWNRADFPMFPSIVDPRSILTVSTFPIPRGGDGGECGFVPSRVRARVGRDGAAVLIWAYHLPPGDRGRKNLRTVPARPTSFHLDEKHRISYPHLQTPRGRQTPGADAQEWVYPFRDRGRMLTAAVLLGPKASAESRRDALAVLESLRFDARSREGPS